MLVGAFVKAIIEAPAEAPAEAPSPPPDEEPTTPPFASAAIPRAPSMERSGVRVCTSAEASERVRRAAIRPQSPYSRRASLSEVRRSVDAVRRPMMRAQARW